MLAGDRPVEFGDGFCQGLLNFVQLLVQGGSMQEKNVLLIGGGNMGSALLRGIIQSGLAPARKITVIDIVPGLLEEIRSLHGVNVDVDVVPHVAGADVILLAVKPQILPTGGR